MNDPSYIVVRGVGYYADGQWWDINDFHQVETVSPPALGTQAIRIRPTTEFEVRKSDGAVAQVYRPGP